MCFLVELWYCTALNRFLPDYPNWAAQFFRRIEGTPLGPLTETGGYTSDSRHDIPVTKFEVLRLQ